MKIGEFMKILHYTLGLPPYRTGGLTKYSIDLVEEQAKNNQIVLLFPGKYRLAKGSKINKYKDYNNIAVYEIINPLPVPLLGGINKIDGYTKADKKAYEIFTEFFDMIKPDVVHIHTLMGLHYEFIIAAKDKNIKLIYTAHDYFGICPKVNLIDYKGNVCNDFCNGEKCIICNDNAYDLKLIYLMQSGIYRSLKDNTIVKKLRKYKKQKVNSNNKINEKINKCIVGDKHDYIKLREFYMKYFTSFDYIHFNSNVTRDIFNRYGVFNEEVVSITHKDVVDKRSKRTLNAKEKLKILYLGPCEKYKGFNLLIDSLHMLNKDNWTLNIYGNSYEIDCGEINNKINFGGRYNYSDLDDIFKKNDVLVIPSIWYETFGFTLLEGLSYGIPIITTQYVGAKDFIEDNYNGFIINPKKDELMKKLEMIMLDKTMLDRINDNIVNSKIEFELEKHNIKIINIYNKVLEEGK